MITHYKGIRVSHFCEYQLKWTSDLKVHKQTKHEKKFVACDKCEFNTQRAGYLNAHKQSKHKAHTFLDVIAEIVILLTTGIQILKLTNRQLTNSQLLISLGSSVISKQKNHIT